MSVIHLLWLLSCVGAAAFFLSGYWFRSLGRKDTHSEIASVLGASIATHNLCESGLTTSEASSALEHELVRLRIDAARAASTIRSLEAEPSLRQEAEQAHLEARGRLEQVSHELAETRRQLSNERAQRAQCELDGAAAKASTRRLENERRKLTDQVRTAERELQRHQNLEQELVRLRQDQARLAAEHAELIAEVNARAETQLDPEVLQARLDMAVAQIQRVQREDESLRQQLQETLEDVVRLQNEVVVTRDEVDRVGAQNDELRSQYDASSNELAFERSRSAEKVEAAETQTIAAQALCEQATQKRALAEVELRSLRGKLEIAEANCAELDRVRHECQLLMQEQVRLGELERELTTCQAQLRELRLKLHSAEAKALLLDRLSAENSNLRERSQEMKEMAELLASAQGEVCELRLRLQAAEPKLAELARLAEENHGLREQVEELRGYSELAAEHERLSGQYKRARLECELNSRRVQELEQERSELFELRTRLSEVTAVAGEVPELKHRAAVLEAMLFSAGHNPESAVMALAEPSATQEALSDDAGLEAALQRLIGTNGVASVALADRQGLLVASAGDARQEEGLAAFAGLADEFAARARTLLPLGNVLRVCLHDANQLEASCRLFQAAGVGYGLTTAAKHPADWHEADQAVVWLSRRLADRRVALQETGST